MRRAPVEIAPGTEVRGFVIEERLGAGGFATVYRARRGERYYALKFIRTQVAGRWAQREVDVLQRLSHPNVVGFQGCGFWPDDSREYSVVIMDYVQGRRLDEWARQENPCALQVTLKVLGVAGALSALHQEKVVHRDVKEPNILVRAADGEAVLVDFGVAGGEQLRRVTQEVLPPGTPEYRAPEAWRFFREHVLAGQGHYEPGPADDVYALGVVLYWLLTERLPCEGATVAELIEATLHQVPVAPRRLNPRVPEALSAVCLRMLEKEPQRRYADGAAVCVAVTEALAGADAEWDMPLCEAHEADRVTTQEEVEKAGDDDGVDRALRQARHAYERPRRGRRPVAVPPAVPEPPAPAEEVRAASAPGPVETSPGSVAGGKARRRVALRVAVGLGVAVALGLGGAWLGPRLQRSGPPAAAFAPPGSAPWREELAALWEPTWQVGWKVAPPWKPPEAVGPVDLGHREEASVKNPQQKAPKQQKKGLGTARKAAGAGALCLTVACTGPQARPVPPPEPCPPGSLERMEQGDWHGVAVWQRTLAGDPPMTVKEGWTTGWFPRRIDLPETAVLSGKLSFCGDRICIRFTEAWLEKEKRTVPICLEAWDSEDDLQPPRREPGSTEDDVKLFMYVVVRPPGARP